MVKITNKIYEQMFVKTGKNNDKQANEDTLQCYVAICLLNDELGVDKTSFIKVMSKIRKKERRTQDIISKLVEMGFVQRTAEGYEAIS